MMGMLIALMIILLWLGHLVYAFLNVKPDLLSVSFYLHVLIQAYLYTGLFITAHDAMHGTVSRYRGVNHAVGILSLLLFAGMNYNKIVKSHYLHHKYPGKAGDPDFTTGSQKFFAWWFKFMRSYITIMQLIIMAIAFNLLNLWISQPKLFAFWIMPAFLSTLQLFYFGTYIPHMLPHTEDMKPHNSRTQFKNHLLAMLSCYFFGYHREHHDSPGTPWWKLYQLK